MSMNRLALRLATVLTLNNNFRAPWPTSAEDRVFDSRNRPPQRQHENEFRPEIVVYTTDDEGEKSVGKRGPMRNRNIDLIVECAVCGWRFDEDDSGNLTANPGYPETDAQMEAKLDVLEAQVRFALANPVNKWAAHWGDAVIKINSWSSGRWAEEAESRTPLASRVIKINVSIHDDCSPEARVVDGEPAIVNRLPPRIERLIAAIDADVEPDLPPDEYVTEIAEMLRHSGVPGEITMRPLKHMKLTATQPDHVRPLGVDIDLDDQA